MNEKVKKIVLWVLTGLIALVFVGSAVNKLIANEEAIQMAKAIGLNETNFRIIGIVEIIALVLFVIPRTGVLGTLLLAAYLGGAIATHLTHQQDILAPILIQAFVWIVAIMRFPELTDRILGKQS